MILAGVDPDARIGALQDMGERREDLDAGIHQFGADRHRHGAADHAGDDREDQVERADVLVIGRKEIAPPAGGDAVIRAVIMGVRVVMRG